MSARTGLIRAPSLRKAPGLLGPGLLELVWMFFEKFFTRVAPLAMVASDEGQKSGAGGQEFVPYGCLG